MTSLVLSCNVLHKKWQIFTVNEKMAFAAKLSVSAFKNFMQKVEVADLQLCSLRVAVLYSYRTLQLPFILEFLYCRTAS